MAISNVNTATLFTQVISVVNNTVNAVNSINANTDIAGNNYVIATFVSNATFQTTLANTNAYIDSTNTFLYNLSQTNLANTNASIAATNTYLYNLTQSNLANTNARITAVQEEQTAFAVAMAVALG